MNHKQRPYLLPALLVAALAISACSPVIDLGATVPPATPAPVETPESVAPSDDSATATVNVRSLRVRAEPGEAAAVIAGIRQGEKYKVLGISSDGLWVQLAIEGVSGGSGWVSANFVNVEGPITDAVTTSVPEATATPVQTAPISDTNTVTDTVATVAATPAPGFALVRTNGTRLRVRGEATADAAVVGYVYDGESYEVLEVSADGLWVRIAGSTDATTDNPNGGWVASQYVVIGQ